MTWVGWRQQRLETLMTVGILALLAALLVPTGLQIASTYHHDGLSACLGQNPSFSCNMSVQSFTSRYESLSHLIAWLTLVPGLIGILFAAPFVGQLEHGTYRLDWTQSITRGRWIAGKLALALGATVLAALAFTLLVSWWRGPFVHIDGRMDNSVYDSDGIVALGYAVFAFGLALVVGVVWRRTAAALVAGFVGYFAARIFTDGWLRQRLIAPAGVTWPISGQPPAKLDHAWVLSQFPSDRLGHAVAVSKACANGSPVPVKVGSAAGCPPPDGGYFHAVYQPASRFWALQGLETLIFAGVGLALVAFAAWWVHQRAS